ncbi:hypothetical protein AGMMS50256_35740 [Betaproteobacteria bacterium]|nr:hypothetical protein AGMMS50256_35740 [Betaproteobacteria bacterium]
MKAVIDTNVLLVANKQHDNVSPDCVSKCVQCLLTIQQSGVTVIDKERRILREYQNKTKPNQPKGVGDVFLKWLLQNMCNTKHVEQLPLTEKADDCFAEFPDPVLEQSFDPPDRKFVAVANKHPEKPPIWQASDCKWLKWRTALKAKGIKVEFLCPDDICQFYHNAFPNEPPVLPHML